MSNKTMKSDMRVLLSYFDVVSIDTLIERLTDFRDDMLAQHGVTNISMELNEHDSDEYVELLAVYKREETPAEHDERIREEAASTFRIQRERRKQERQNLREQFLNGDIAAAEYDIAISKIPPG